MKIGKYIKLYRSYNFAINNMSKMITINNVKKASCGLIYLIQPALVLNSNIYKVGKTSKTNLDRLNSYGRKSRVFLVLESNNVDDLEKRIIDKMSKKYTLFHGKEYFEGNIKFMKDDILNEYLKL